MPQEQPKYSLAYKERQSEKDKAVIAPKKVQGEWHGSDPGTSGGTIDRNLINPGERWLDSVKYRETKT